MTHSKKIIFISLILSFFMLAACQTTTRNISTQEKMHYDEAYDFSDKKTIVDALVKPFLAEHPTANEAVKPIIIVYGIANHTSEHIDTSGITDAIRMELLRSGRFRFINETQRENIAKETGYQYSGATDPATRIELGRQLGAQYVMSGTLRSIEKEEGRGIRLSKKSLKYYSLNLELTDIKTSMIEWADSVELAREASRPIIGW